MGDCERKGWSRKAVRKSVETRKRLSSARLELVRPAIEQAKSEGHSSTRQIAAYLNAKGIRTSRNKLWRAGQVSRMLARMAESTPDESAADPTPGHPNTSELPDWPAMMKRSLAALYCGLSGPEFDSEILAGRLPRPRQLGASELWSRAEIDTWLAQLAADTQPRQLRRTSG